MISILEVTELCSSETGEKLFSFLGHIFNIIKIIVPILIVVYGMIDLIKSLISNKDDEMKKNQKLFIKRLIYGICVFFITSIVIFVLEFTNENIKNDCLEIFLNPSDISISKTTIDVKNIESENECNKQGKPYIWRDNECKIDMTKDNIE